MRRKLASTTHRCSALRQGLSILSSIKILLFLGTLSNIFLWDFFRGMGFGGIMRSDQAGVFPGFFVGNANSNDDLVACWNLRAADIPVSFVDLSHAARYENIPPVLKAAYQEQVASPPEWGRHLTIWASSEETFEPAHRLLGEGTWSRSSISPHLWNGLNVRPPMMILGEASAMAVGGPGSGSEQGIIHSERQAVCRGILVSHPASRRTARHLGSAR